MKNILLIIISLFCAVNCAKCDNSPLEFVKQYFNSEFEDYTLRLTGEAKKNSFDPKSIQEGVKLEFETLTSTKGEAVVAVEMSVKEETRDWYVFIKKDSVWKISAFRTLAMPGMFYMALSQYVDTDEAGLEIEYKKMYNDKKKDKPELEDKDIVEIIGTLRDFKFNIMNMKLTIYSDKELKEYFLKHKEQFIDLADKFKKDTSVNEKTGSKKKSKKYENELQDLLLSGISHFNKKTCIKFLIGGMLDNSVGYFYCDNPENLPEISDSNFIMIRKIDEAWYIYKTT